MRRREFCALPLILAGCGGNDMAEFLIQPSPTRTAHLGQSDVPGYAYGNWTPTLKAGSNSATHSLQMGVYTKVGNLVQAWYYVITSAKASGASALRIDGLPFPTSSRNSMLGLSSNLAMNNVVWWEGTATSFVGMVSRGSANIGVKNERFFSLHGITAAGTAGYDYFLENVDVNDVAGFRGCFIYFTDE